MLKAEPLSLTSPRKRMCPEQAPLLAAGIHTCACHPSPHPSICFAISEVLSATSGFPHHHFSVTFIDCPVLSCLCNTQRASPRVGQQQYRRFSHPSTGLSRALCSAPYSTVPSLTTSIRVHCAIISSAGSLRHARSHCPLVELNLQKAILQQRWQ